MLARAGMAQYLHPMPWHLNVFRQAWHAVFCVLVGWPKNHHCLLNLIGPDSVGDVTSQPLRSYTVSYKTAESLLWTVCLKSSKTRSSRKPHQLLLPHASTIRFLNFFFYHSALLWNSLPHSIQTITSKPAFRIAVKDHWSTFKYRTDTHILSV